MRTVLYDVGLFLLPFLAFFAYATWANKHRAISGADPLRTPWFWLMIVGLVLAIGGFFALRATIEDHTGQYIPAVTNPDGSVTPGHYEGDDHKPAHVDKPQTPPPEPPPPPVPKRP